MYMVTGTKHTSASSASLVRGSSLEMNIHHHLLLLLVSCHTCWGACYFSIELQGQFLMQSAFIETTMSYSQLNITAEAIPIWGHCHRRIGNNVILMDTSLAKNCIRCFHLKLRSRNVLQVLTEGLDKCYTNEEAAEATCPDEANLHLGEPSKEILLYKIKDLNGEMIQPEYCPINGHFSFTYRSGAGECTAPDSSLDNCPSASALNLSFHGCTFPDFDMTYFCLGHWAGPNNQHYLALLSHGVDRFPRYRCALYQEEPDTGNVFLAFSSDSTCHSDLHNATSGYERLNLSMKQPPKLPQQVYSSTCRFPDWALGHWQHLHVDVKQLTYKDHFTFKTYTMHCLGPHVNEGDRFLVYAHNQCGEHMYNCILMKRRSTNVLEFKLGLRSSNDLNNSLCSDFNFQDKAWITQGRLDRVQETPCPIAGEYTGIIPDVSGLCAKLSSDCRSPEIMYYTVSDCAQPEVYEEREYRCLGQWEEDGLMYTYTQRRDVGTYECFVGSIVSKDDIYIKEAGDHCQRKINPLDYGMKLNRKGSCLGGQMNPGSPQRPHPTGSWLSSKYPSEPTKPWKPITAPPQTPQNSAMRNVVPLIRLLGPAFLMLTIL